MFTYHRRTFALIGVIGATGLAVAGCGSGSDGSSADRTGTGTTAGSAAAANATDRAFVAQMIPHHEMAIEMSADTAGRADHSAIATLGSDITRSQQREIDEMKAIARTLGVTPAPAMHQMSTSGGTGAQDASMASDARVLGLSVDGMGMSMGMSSLKTARPFDRAFIDEMIPHHQGAIRMARAELRSGKNQQLKQLAVSIVAAQTKEIRQMNAWRTAWYGSASPAGGVPAA